MACPACPMDTTTSLNDDIINRRLDYHHRFSSLSHTRLRLAITHSACHHAGMYVEKSTLKRMMDGRTRKISTSPVHLSSVMKRSLADPSMSVMTSSQSIRMTSSILSCRSTSLACLRSIVAIVGKRGPVFYIKSTTGY